jgi:hypothetical protein
VHANKQAVKSPASTRSPTCSRPTGRTTRTASRTSSSTSADRSLRGPEHPRDLHGLRGQLGHARESAQCTAEDSATVRATLRRDRRAGERLGCDLPDRQHRMAKAKNEELTEWEFLRPSSRRTA